MGLAFPFVIFRVSGFCSGVDVSGSKSNSIIIQFSLLLKETDQNKPKSVTGKEAPFPSPWLEWTMFCQFGLG